MTTLDILGGDWRIHFNDETVNSLTGQAGLRMVEYITGVKRPYNEVYSAVADNSDFFQAMTFKNPMTPTTPNAYVMANDYFMSRASMEQTFEGALDANWALKTVGTGNDAFGHGVIKKIYDIGLGSNFVAGDVGRRVIESASSDSGTLLAFDIDPDGTLVAWIRPDDSTPGTGDIFDSLTGTIAVTGDGGVGTVDCIASIGAGISGLTKWSAIQAIGAAPTATEVFALQDRFKLADSATGLDQYWVTDTTVSLGIISIAVMIQNSGVLIADGDVEVFARRYTALYDHFRLNVAAGGFQALPLASQPDLNNTTGYRTTGTLASITGTATVGNGIYVGGTWATATARGVITETNGNTDLEYYLVGTEVGALPDIGSTTAIFGYDFSTAADDGFDATTGTVGVNLGGPTDTTAGEGGNLTLTLGAVTTEDFDGNGTPENYSVEADAQSNIGFGKVYERFKYVTRRGADEADLFGAGTNQPGETYRGLEATGFYDALTSTMVDGDDVTIAAGDSGAKTNFSARLVAQNVTPADSVQAYITLMDIQTSLTSAQPADNDVVDGEGANDVTLQEDGAGGVIQRYTAPKSSPLGTSTGTALFLSRGVIIVNPDAADTQAYTATPDTQDTPLSPPNTISVNWTNTRAGDRIMGARDTGVAGVIDRDQFGGMATPAGSYNSQDDLLIRVAGTVDAEVMNASVVRVKENALLQEHRYYYSSVTKQALGEFTLTALTGGNTGTATASSSATQLVDDGRDFVSDGVLVGMLVRNTTLGKVTHVWEVTAFATTGLTSNDTLIVRALYGTPDDWDSTDTYIINALIQTYDTNDDLFDLVLDVEEQVGTDGTPGSEANSFVKIPAADFDIVVEVRNGKLILPFAVNQTISDNSVTINVVRQPDTIAT